MQWHNKHDITNMLLTCCTLQNMLLEHDGGDQAWSVLVLNTPGAARAEKGGNGGEDNADDGDWKQ